MKYVTLISFVAIFLVGCASSMPAPVEDRPTQNNNKKTSHSASKAQSSHTDWRPDSYIVKKGDTLYSIGLNHGLDYREIAAANNIPQPYTIKIGQRIDISSLKKKEAENTAQTVSRENEDGVIVTPVDIGGDVTTNSSSGSAVTPVLNEPKAIREPYSQEALNRKAPTKATTVTTLPKTPAEATASTAIKTPAVSATGWAWPTKGKVIARFGQTKNKGIDIAGQKGQAITASAGGKVIYVGSDLRGYGKLVIIKHNKSFLSVYAHNSKLIVKEGQLVKTGQKIAAMGNTDTNRIKLHFEIRQKGKSVDPEKFLPQN